MFEDFFVSRWAVIAGIAGTTGSVLILTASIITLVLAYRDYKNKSSIII